MNELNGPSGSFNCQEAFLEYHWVLPFLTDPVRDRHGLCP